MTKIRAVPQYPSGPKVWSGPVTGPKCLLITSDLNIKVKQCDPNNNRDTAAPAKQCGQSDNPAFCHWLSKKKHGRQKDIYHSDKGEVSTGRSSRHTAEQERNHKRN